MLKGFLQTIAGVVLFLAAISFLSGSKGSQSTGLPVVPEQQKKLTIAAQELKCDLPGPVSIPAGISGEKLRTAEINIIMQSVNLDNKKQAILYYKNLEEELSNFPGNLNEFKSRFDKIKGWRLENGQKEDLLASHKDYYERTCNNYKKALMDKHSRIRKAINYVSQ